MSPNIQRLAWFVGALILVALAARQPATLSLATMLSLGLALAYAWARFSLRGIRYSRTFNHPRMFWGETADMTVCVSNYNRFPVPCLEVRDDLPAVLEVKQATLWSHHLPHRRYFVNIMSLAGRQLIRRTYRVSCHRRGRYHIGPSILTTRDPFGLFEQQATAEDRRELLVYPRFCPVVGHPITSARPSGIAKERPWQIADPERVTGVRPYRPTDPMRTIHWRATARTGQLQTKTFEPSSSSFLAVFCDVATYRELWEKIDERALEFTITVAASLLIDAYERGLAVGLYTNGTIAGSPYPLKVPVGRSPKHILDALEALAMLGPVAAVTLTGLLAAEHAGLAFGTSIVAVTSIADDELVDELARCRRRGYPVALVVAGTRSIKGTQAVPVYCAVEEGLPGGGSVIAIR